MSTHPLYPHMPGLKAHFVSPAPNGYTEQSGEYGTRPGTILPHHDARIPFEQLDKPKHSVPIGVMMVQEPTKENPFGGIQMLTPMFDSGRVTPAIQEEARKQAETMSDDPMQRGLLMYKLMAEKAQQAGQPAAATPPPAPLPNGASGASPSAPALVPAAPAVGGLDLNVLAQVLAAMQVQATQSAAAAIAAPPPPSPQMSAVQAAPPVPVSMTSLPLPSVSLPGYVQSLTPQPSLAPQPLVPPPSLFEGLQIPGLESQPQPPRAKVSFDLGEGGRYTGVYHWVLQERKALLLVFDTRYDYPVWIPPATGPQRTIVVEVTNAQNGGQPVRCYSLGTTFNFGVFQFIMLVVADQEG